METRSRLFEKISVGLVRHPRAISLVSIILVAGSIVWLAMGKLGINASRSSVVDADDPEQARLARYLDRFGSAHDIVVLVEGPDVEALHAAADKVAAELHANPLVSGVFYKIDLSAMAVSAPWYVPTAELKRLRSGLDLAKKLAGGSSAVTHVAGIADLVKRSADGIETFAEDGELPTGVGKDQLDGLPTGEIMKLLADRLTELDGALVEGKQPFAYDGVFSTTDARVGLDRDGYLAVLKPAKDSPGHALLMQVRSERDVLDEKVAIPLTLSVRAAADKVNSGTVKTWITGVPVLFAEERQSLTSDLTRAGILAAIVTALIFLIAYRSLWFCILCFVPVLSGTLVSLVVISLIYGALGLVSSIIAVTLVGIGSDFAVHLLSRFQVERAQGGDYADVTRRTMVGAGPPIMMGALTSIASFAAMALTDFRATRELGVISSIGLVLVLLATFAVLPVMEGRRPMKAPSPTPKPQAASTWTWPSHLDWPIIGGLLVITVVLGLCIRPIQFNFDSKSFIAADSDSMRALDRLIDYDLGELDYAVTQAPTEAQSLAQRHQIEALGKDIVSRVESLADVVPADVATKAPEVAAIRIAARDLPKLEFEVAPSVNPTQFRADLKRLGSALANDLPFTLRTLGMGGLAGELEPVRAAVVRLSDRVAGLDDALLVTRMQRLDTELGAAFAAVRPFFSLPPERAFVVEDLPKDFTSRFYQPASADQAATYAVRVYPTHAPEDPKYMAIFRKALRDIDPEATGAAITYSHFAVLMASSLVQAGAWALLIVFLIVVVDLRNARDVGLAFVPLVMGATWMVGLMNVLSIDYNFSNVLAIPLIIGLGVDSGLHIIHRYRECGSVGVTVRTTGRAIVVSAFTTIGAFGVLVFSENKGSAALGATLALGVSSCMVLATAMVPALLSRLEQRRSAGH